MCTLCKSCAIVLVTLVNAAAATKVSHRKKLVRQWEGPSQHALRKKKPHFLLYKSLIRVHPVKYKERSSQLYYIGM